MVVSDGKPECSRSWESLGKDGEAGDGQVRLMATLLFEEVSIARETEPKAPLLMWWSSL